MAVHVEMLSLNLRPALGDLLEMWADGFPMRKGFLESKILQVVGDDFQAEVSSGLHVGFEKGIAEVGSEDKLAMFNPFHDRLEFAFETFVQAPTE